LRPALEAHLEERKPFDVEERQRAKSGEYRWYRARGQALWDEAGNPVRMVGFTSDITGRKQAEARTRATLEEKESLLREVHHRVKNNLQAIIALIAMRIERTGDAATRRFLQELQEQARTMSLVYEQLYQSDNLARVDMQPYLHRLATNVLEAFGEGRAIELSVEAAPLSLDVSLAMPCGLIVNELLTNALKHAFPPAFPGAGRIVIALQAAGEKYTLSVSDNGVGLPPGLDWRQTQSQGLRLVNLWASHQLGGGLEADTRQGTTFRVTFVRQNEGRRANG